MARFPRWSVSAIFTFSFLRSFLLSSGNFEVVSEVTEIGRTLFSECDIFLLTDEPSIVLEHELATSLALESLSNYRIQLNPISKRYLNSSKVLTPGEEWRYFDAKPAGLSRHKANCALVIIALNEASDEMSRFLFRLLTPKHFEVTRKDQDHYLFAMRDAEAGELMKSVDFGAKLKYKLAVPVDGAGSIFKTICFFCNGGRPEYIHLNIEKPLKLSSLFPDFIKDMNGTDFVAAVSKSTIQRVQTYVDEGGTIRLKRGLYAMVLEVLQSRFNFQHRIIYSYGDGGPGRLLPNGTWFGSVASVMHGTAQLGMVTAQTAQRSAAVGFSYPIQYEWISFATGHPRPIHSWRTIYKPLNLVMWALVLVSTLAVFASFILLTSSIGEKWKIDRVFTYIVGTVLEQSQAFPTDSAVLILCAFWFFFGVIISNAYKSKLFTFLVFPEKTVVPSTFSQLANSEDFEWGLMWLKGAAYAIFATSKEDTYVKIYKKWGLYPNDVECFGRTTTDNFACISWGSFAEYTGHKNFSDRQGRKMFNLAPSATTYFVPCGYVHEHRAIFHENFDNVIKWSHATGLVHKWEDIDWTLVRQMRFDWLRETNQSEELDRQMAHDRGEAGPSALQVHNLIGAWALLVILLVGSTVVFLLEWAWKSVRRITTFLYWHRKDLMVWFSSGGALDRRYKRENKDVACTGI